MKQRSITRKVIFKKLVLSTFVLALALTMGYDSFGAKTAALSGSQFSAGRIIDDGLFYNGASMSIAEIQAFLNSKVPVCDNNGTQPYGGTTRAAYGASRGYPAPYTCLKDYSQVVPETVDPSGYCPGTVSAGNKSAATMIYEVGAACGVSQKILIVLLQKEKSLITDDWPWTTQYRNATGYGCPDTAPCDSDYYWFFNQVYQAAKAYKRYRANPANYNYRPGQNNNIYWHPSGGSYSNEGGVDDERSGCGQSNVYIENQATAGLYIYTPYRPNPAALGSLRGTGDGCSSYGNRNFWVLYNDWFGTTYASGYSWQWAGQYAYTDQNKTTPKSLSNLSPGEKAYLVIKARNIGGTTWQNTGQGAVKVGTASPLERPSRFAPGSSWLTGTRPAAMTESSVAPGEVGTFEFWITSPSVPGQGGTYNERFNLVAEGLIWFNDIGLSFGINAQSATYAWQWAGQYAYTDETKTTTKSLNGLLPGDRVYVGFRAKNMGNMTWTNGGANAVKVGTSGPLERTSAFSENTWLGPSRPAAMKESNVPPGSTGTFEFWMTVPNNPGSYSERFNLVAEGLTWMNDLGLSYGITVTPKIYSWQWAGQYAYTDQTKTTPKSLIGVAPGERVYVGFRAKNTGNVAWQNTGSNPLRVGTVAPIERTSIFKDNRWLGATRPVVMLESSVPPGSNGTFEFWLTIPNNPGDYNERFGLLAEGLAWLNDTGLSYGIKVQ